MLNEEGIGEALAEDGDKGGGRAASLGMAEHFITDTLNKPDSDFDIRLRPSRFQDFIGQKKNRERLELFVQAARGREDVLEHVLLSGPPGLGKRQHQGDLGAGD
jgi:hypothetical protein